MTEAPKNKFFKSSEEIISMFLGLAIVLVIGGIVFNYFQKKRGNIEVPGVTSNININEVTDRITNIEQQKESENKNTSEKPAEVKPNNQMSSGTYEVKKGDNLWKIAQAKYGNGDLWVKIAQANKLANPRMVFSGDKLVLPEIKSQSNVAENKTNIEKKETPTALGEYKVIKGDNLWNIAVKNCTDGYQWVKIWENNKKLIRNPGLIEIGMSLKMPESCPAAKKVAMLR
ncbi:MAG TPA: LysM peptidoglycan-binding domain-containing protein [Patescibacteria group bacterium]